MFLDDLIRYFGLRDSLARRCGLLGNQIGDQMPWAPLTRTDRPGREFRLHTVRGSIAGGTCQGQASDFQRLGFTVWLGPVAV